MNCARFRLSVQLKVFVQISGFHLYNILVSQTHCQNIVCCNALSCRNGSILSTSPSHPHIVTSPAPPHTLPSSSTPTPPPASQNTPRPTVSLTVPSYMIGLQMVPSDVKGGSTLVPVILVCVCVCVCTCVCVCVCVCVYVCVCVCVCVHTRMVVCVHV